MTIIRKDTLKECKFQISVINENAIQISLNESFVSEKL